MNYNQTIKDKGYLLIKDCISIEDCKKYKDIIKNYFSKNKDKIFNNGKPNAFNQKELFELHRLFENKKLISILREISSNNLMFLNHSDIHYNFKAYGWHDDTQTRWLSNCPKNYSFMHDEVVNTDKPYELYTIAIYFQDEKEGGGLSIVEGSHKNGKGCEISNRKTISSQKIIDIKTNLGDIIIFDARLFHRGRPGLENDRASIFFRMGNGNVHALYHAMGAISRQNRQNSEIYKNSPELKYILSENNIIIPDI